MAQGARSTVKPLSEPHARRSFAPHPKPGTACKVYGGRGKRAIGPDSQGGIDTFRHALHPIQAVGNDALVRFSRHHRRPQLTPGVSMMLSIRQKMKADFLWGQDQRAVPKVR